MVNILSLYAIEHVYNYHRLLMSAGLSQHKSQREHSPLVTITIDVTTGWLFEDGYAKEAARYFQTA